MNNSLYEVHIKVIGLILLLGLDRVHMIQHKLDLVDIIQQVRANKWG